MHPIRVNFSHHPGDEGLSYNVSMHWDFIGNSWAVDLLRRQIGAGALRHAYLFTGPQAVGKRTLALRFAQALLCGRAAAVGDPCEQRAGPCRACRLVPAGSHPDLHQVEVEQGRSVVRVDQVRSLQRSLALAPYEASRRVALLPDFQAASDGAANALLKTLEEPPPATMLILTAPRVESLLPTIVSRCEVYNLRALPSTELVEALEGRGMPAEQAQLLAGLSGGRPGQALAMADDPAGLSRREGWLDDLMAILTQDRRGRFAYVHSSLRGKGLEAQRQESMAALETWLGLWRDAVLLAAAAHGRIANPDRRSELRQLVEGLPQGQIADALQHTRRTLEAVGQFVNPRLALETLMLELPHMRAPLGEASGS